MPSSSRRKIARHGELRYIINTEPHGDHWAGNAYFDAPVIAHEGVRQRILDTDLAEHVARVAGMGPEEPPLLENYTPNAPVVTFRDGMTLHLGDHTFQMISMPGHTLYQAAILIKEEGVVFTSDNIFHKVQTYIQEANPDQWLRALESPAGVGGGGFCAGPRPLVRQGLSGRTGGVYSGVERVCPPGGGTGNDPGGGCGKSDRFDRPLSDGCGAGWHFPPGNADERRQPVGLLD